MAPGPVFIHAAPCEAYAGTEFPAGLRGLPLAFEGRASGGIVSGFSANAELRAEQQIAALFALAPTRYVHVRHAQAGCFIARVDRLDVPSVSGRVAA